jgi:hypothetical protein
MPGCGTISICGTNFCGGGTAPTKFAKDTVIPSKMNRFIAAQ